jgi:hypothetical protein
MVQALWPSHRYTDDQALRILRNVDVLLALVYFAELAYRACPVTFRLLIGDLHQAFFWNLIAMGGSITIDTDACHRRRIAQLGFANFHGLSLLQVNLLRQSSSKQICHRFDGPESLGVPPGPLGCKAASTFPGRSVDVSREMPLPPRVRQ